MVSIFLFAFWEDKSNIIILFEKVTLWGSAVVPAAVTTTASLSAAIAPSRTVASTIKYMVA